MSEELFDTIEKIIEGDEPYEQVTGLLLQGKEPATAYIYQIPEKGDIPRVLLKTGFDLEKSLKDKTLWMVFTMDTIEKTVEWTTLFKDGVIFMSNLCTAKGKNGKPRWGIVDSGGGAAFFLSPMTIERYRMEHKTQVVKVDRPPEDVQWL